MICGDVSLRGLRSILDQSSISTKLDHDKKPSQLPAGFTKTKQKIVVSVGAGFIWYGWTAEETNSSVSVVCIILRTNMLEKICSINHKSASKLKIVSGGFSKLGSKN